MFKDFLKFFHINKSERLGFTVLLILMLVLVILKITVPLFENQDNLSLKDLDIDSIGEYQNSGKINLQERGLNRNNSAGNISKNSFEKNSDKDITTISRKFNPNTTSSEEMILIGIRPKLAKIIAHYVEKGGRIKNNEDILRIYGIRESEKQILLEAMDIPKEWQKVVERSGNGEIFIPIEINQSDSAELISVKGIGPFLAHKIISYRRKLGGFYSISQLADVQGFNSEKIQELSDKLKVSPEYIYKIDINKEDVQSLANHPYLTYKDAEAIVEYRGRNGLFSNSSELKEILLLDKENLRKVSPYLKFK